MTIYKVFVGGVKVLETFSRKEAQKRWLRAAASTQEEVRMTHENRNQ
jgi:hypothetical protein